MADGKSFSQAVQKIKLLSKSKPGDNDHYVGFEKPGSETETDSSSLSVDMEEEVFSLGYIPLDIFAQKLKAHLKRQKERKRKLRHINLGKNGYITDAVVRCLVQIIGKKKLSKIVKISLEGCTLLTDLGIHWLVQGLSKNKNKVQVNINGCFKIKDGGFATLATAQNIGYIEAMATSVSHSCQDGNTKGCPLLVNTTSQKTNFVKDSYVVIIPMGTEVSLSEFLATETPSRRKPFHYLSAVEMSSWRIALAELEQNHVLMDHMLPPCPVHVIITFDANLDVQQLKTQVIDTIAYVLSKETPNPKQTVQKTTSIGPSNCFMGASFWSKCFFSLDGILRNMSDNLNSVGAVVSRQQMSRTHNYFEVQCLSCQPETGILLGIMHDILITERFSMESKEYNGGLVEGVDLEAGAVYGFGITGRWESEYVPCEDAEFCITMNGTKMVSKPFSDQAHSGLYPVVSLIGRSPAEVKLLNQACPSEKVIQEWEEKCHFWTPVYWSNILCDDQGILSYIRTDHTDKDSGLMLCQEEITRTHNTFAIEVIEISSGVITVGVGPENYPLNEQPGVREMSVAFQGDSNCGNINLCGDPDSQRFPPLKNGDEIKAVVNMTGERVWSDGGIKVDFYVNSLLVGSAVHKLTGEEPGGRFVFMLGLKGAGVKARVLNYRPFYQAQPPRMDMLTMGRCNFMNIYDDGRLLYRKFDNHDVCGLFLSKTPFNAKLTYFELKVTNLNPNQNACIGFGHRDYPINKMLGQMLGSVGYRAATGQLHHNGSAGVGNPTSKEGKQSTCFGKGDTMGCGFKVKSAKFREDGSLENQQILKFYFTKNGKKVHKVDFEYLSDGIYPGANIRAVGDEMVLSNYYPYSECEGDEDVEDDKVTFIEGCKFTMVGTGDEESHSQEKIKALQAMLSEGFEFPMLPVISRHIQEMESKPGLMDLQAQKLYGQLCWQKECMDRFLSNKSRLTFMSVIMSSGQGHRELVDHIVQVCEVDLANHPSYYNLHESVNVGLRKITTALTTEKLMAANELMDLLGTELGHNGRTFEAAIQHLQAKGQLVSFPFKRTLIALDIQFSETLIHMMEASPDILSGKIAPCLGEKTHIWNSAADIFSDLQQISSSKMELLNHVLQCLGVMRIPRLRVHKDNPMFCYCTSNTLGDLPVHLSDFLENTTENVVLIGRDYNFLYNNPNHILSMIVSRCIQFFQALAVSKSWSVFQSGAAQTLIYVTGGNGLKLETRCFMPSQLDGQIDADTKYHVEEYAFNIFGLFTDLIDHLIAKLKIKVIYKDQVPPNLVNNSIGCIHHWGLSSEVFRQTVCTLCGQCCDKGPDCLYNGLGGQYQHQCGCNTRVTGCKDCGICQSCADQLWTIRSYLRPNLEVASYNKMKNNPAIPLNATTYDEVEFTNLSPLQTPICLKMTTSQYSTSAAMDYSGSIVKMFPGMATMFPHQQSLQEHMEAQNSSTGNSQLMTLEQGDTIIVKLDPIKREADVITEIKEESVAEITPVYFTSKCQNTKVWHETGIVAYTSTSVTESAGLFMSAAPLTRACPSFSFEILDHGKDGNIAIGLSAGNPLISSFSSNGCISNGESMYIGSGLHARNRYYCLPGDIVKCEINFPQQSILFYINDRLAWEPDILTHFGSYHAVVGFHSSGQAVRLLEKEPWQMAEDKEPWVPDAFDSYNYGNIQLSPGKTVTLINCEEELSAWLMIHNSSKSIVGYKVLSPLVPEFGGWLKPSTSGAFPLLTSLEKVKNLSENDLFIDVHWFFMESSRYYTDINFDQIYSATMPESLLKHRLQVKIKEVQAISSQPLKLASQEPDENDHYLAEVFKNGISVQKYWLMGGNYTFCLPQQSKILVRYPKFPTLCQPNGFQKGMRVVVDLSGIHKDVYAEAMIEEVTLDGDLRLQYSISEEELNSQLSVTITSPEITLKNTEDEQVQKTVDAAAESETNGKKDNDTKLGKAKLSALDIVPFKPMDNTAAAKRAYKFPPFHLLTEASQAAVVCLDNAWEVNSLISVAQCKTLPTRLTVQELQISQLVGSNTDWLVGATESRKFDLAFAFLPLKLGYKELCYPTVPRMFTEFGVHRLCFLVDQMYLNIRLAKKFKLALDAPLHFVNVAPIPPSSPLSVDVTFASSFTGWTYSTLYSNRLHLPLCDNIFPEGKPDFSRNELEQLMKSLIHIYAAQCHLFAEQHGGIMFEAAPENGSQMITSCIEHMDDSTVKTTDKAELSSDTLIRKKFRNNVYCKAHQWCLPGTNIIMKEEFNFRSELFAPYQETINLIVCEMAKVTSLKPDFYSFFPNLQYLELQSCEQLKGLPDGISKCLRLEMLSFKNSAIEVLPADLFQSPCLLRLHCVDLKVQTLPTTVINPSPITELTLANLQLTSVPQELGNLSNLEYLNLNSNPLEMLPMELKLLTKLKTLLLCGIPWIVTADSKVEMPLDQFEDFLKTNSPLKHYLGKEKLIALFHEFDHNKNSHLDGNELAQLNAALFWKVPRIGATCINCTEYGGIPPVIFLLSDLETLHLDFQAITSVPVHICRLQKLKVLSISNNPLLESLSGTLGHLPNLKSLRLFSNPSLRTPPHEVVSRGFAAVRAYLKKLAGGFTECRRTKLMLVGLGGAGKTSLLRALMSVDKRSAGTKGEDITNGIDILPWTVRTSDNLEVTYNTWDFAGQTLYYNTHQFFLSKRAVYLLLWSTRQGFEHAGLEFWLSSIASHAPKTPILIVGTHCDQVPKADIPMSELRERYPQIAGFHFVSSIEGTGVAELEKELLQVTLELKNMGEKVPKVWLNMEKKILASRINTSVLPWKVITEFGAEVGLYEEKDVREAIQFLHELGTVQYFDNEFLRDQVVINPQWIVNVMSCVVSVKNSPIQENHGKFFHKDMPVIWESYPPELHRWLLLLTEEFDLTFPLPDEDINIVPCLLPHEVPQELNWSETDAKLDLRETKFTYHFTYLPAGLFNRAQVRLFQLSDGKLIWKRGSVLKKNKHKALISQISDSELQIKVQGPRPQNVLFLIHEIFESLIKESFHGVNYELLVPCPDCIIKEGTLDPCMFEGSFVRRAREHKAPFLQCRKYFHTISMAQLFECMPLDSATDFDAQLQNSLTMMQQLNSAMSTDVAIIYSARDKVSDSQSGINPEQIKKDLEKDGLTCWYSDKMDSVSVQDVMLALKNCKVVIALLSDNFEQDERSRDLLLYTMDTLVKDFIIVVIAESLEWENTDLGMRIGRQEEMVMIKNKSRYASRVEDMVKAVRNKVNQNQEQIQQHPSVFMSYCWSNSRDAQSRGTKCPSEALGWGDPRDIKRELEKRGISCWIDIDQPAAGKGLFKNITEGIRNSQVLVAFVSNEYVKSNNCMMELRFAILNMNLPVVIAAVGTGNEWKQSEIGILIHRSKAVKVSFQEENPKALDLLETNIKQKLVKTDDNAFKMAIKQPEQPFQKAEKKTEERKMSDVDPDRSIFQEEYELMQRKFMRHIVSYLTSTDSVPTPRLIVVDFEKRAMLPSNGMEIQNVTPAADSQKRKKLQSSFRPKFSIRHSRTMKVSHEGGEDNWENEAFCLKVLCEDEKGWHVCETSFPIKMNDNMKSMIRGCSAYLARMYAILRQSAVTLNCFDGPAGFKFTSWVDQHALNNANFLDSYFALRTKLVEDDKAGQFLSQLHRCHLPTGKVYWLCTKHSSGPRITHLSTEVTTRNEVGRVYYEEDVKLKEVLEHSDVYKKKKKAKSPSAGVILPKIVDALPSESLASEDRQLAFTAPTVQNVEFTSEGVSALVPQDTARTDIVDSQGTKKDVKSKFCSLQ